MAVHVDDGLHERTRRFLRQVVSDPAAYGAVLVFAGELRGVRGRIRVRRAVRVALECDGGNGDDGTRRQLGFQISVFGFAVGEPESPAIVVDDDGDVIRVVERRGAQVESGIVESPLRRRRLPNQLREVTPIFFIARPTTLGGEVELIPPLEL